MTRTLTAPWVMITLLASACAVRPLPVTDDMQTQASRDAGALPDGASVAQCAAENTFFVEGDPGEPLHPGAETISPVAWMTLNASDLDTFAVYFPGNATQWEVAFSTLWLNQPLTPGFYADAGRWPDAVHFHPTFWIYPDRNPPPTCYQVTGWFDITSIAGGPTSAEFTEIVAAFEQHCDGSTAALRGCIHLRR